MVTVEFDSMGEAVRLALVADGYVGGGLAVLLLDATDPRSEGYMAEWGVLTASVPAAAEWCRGRGNIAIDADTPAALLEALEAAGTVRMADRSAASGMARYPLATVAGGLATLMWTVPGGAQETGGPYMRDPRHPRHFTDEFKRQIVDLYNAGKPKREIMDEYDLGKSTVERWIKSINATGSPRAADNRTPEQNRILELERENRRLRMEVDVLKQAALIYARK